MKHKLTVIGLGPGSKEYLTIGAMEAMKSGKKIVLRTQKHPVVSYLESQGITYTSFDKVYDEKKNFDEVYETIVEELLTMVKVEDIIYAVPGSPFVAEYTVSKLVDRANIEDVFIEFVPAVSFIEAIFHTLKKDPIKGVKILDGLQLDKQMPDVDADVIVTQVYNGMVAADVKIRLMNFYPDEYPIVIIRGAGIPGEEKIEKIMLYELDRIKWLDYLTSIYIPKMSDNKTKSYTIKDLIQIMEVLRGEGGCPWDAEQTHESLKPHLIEEAYEVLEALDNEDMVLLEEELGDLLLQVVFHALLASERGDFHMGDVIRGICDKLIYRHPHVFEEVEANSASEAVSSWEEMKRREKNIDSHTDNLRRIPKQLPALMRSYKVQKKASKIGFDWENIEGAMEKVKEELEELIEARKEGSIDQVREEMGDLIFSIVNVSRFLSVEPEIALHETTEKFISRFEFIENAAKEDGKTLEGMSLEEMDSLWNLAKIHKNKKNDKKYR